MCVSVTDYLELVRRAYCVLGTFLSHLCMNPNSLVKFIVITPVLQKRKPRSRVVSSKSRVTVAKKAWSQHPRRRGAPSLRSGTLVAFFYSGMLDGSDKT